jgi:type 1 glutamine amidotransferase
MRNVLLACVLVIAACDERAPIDPSTMAASTSASATSGAGGNGGNGASSGGSGGSMLAPPRVLLFSKTAGYRHESIPTAIAALEAAGSTRGWTTQATEDASLFTAQTLAAFDVVAFVMTTGDVLDAGQEAAFQAFIQAGGGYAGVHSASDTEYGWSWYGGLCGAYFAGHPAIQPATLIVENVMHPATQHLGPTWMRTDEWYSFDHNPRPEVDVLVSIDEATYDVGGLAMGDHPMAWSHEYDGGWAFYTALGHSMESYAEPEFMEHLVGGIEWAAGHP